MTQRFQKFILLIASIALVTGVGWFCYRVHVLSVRHGEINADFAKINSIGKGVLSVNTWRDLFVNAMENKIDSFKLSKGQADTLKIELQSLLHKLLDEADKMLEDKDQTVAGKIKASIAKIFINEDKIHDKVPEFSQSIYRKLVSPSSKQRLKALARSMLSDFKSTTYDSSKNSKETTEILKRYHVGSKTEFNNKVRPLTDELEATTYNYTYCIIASLLTVVFIWWLIRKSHYLHKLFYLVSILIAFEVLLVGLATPMIEIDARIKSLDFHLVGTKIAFADQVIFFQSKSIVDVVHLLIATGKYDSILVGGLILIFSIVFPISKLASAGVHLLGSKKIKLNPVINFFAFKSGKWSMADVNVIAIFMAYIGFKGILTDQLAKVDLRNETVTSIATNHTSLQPGYIIFICFVLFGLMLSVILKKITHVHS